ncbi:MAG: hypothetical protein ACRDPT_14420 [Streptomycetales bacterium]
MTAWTVAALYIDQIDDALMLAKHAEEYRIDYNLGYEEQGTAPVAITSRNTHRASRA